MAATANTIRNSSARSASGGRPARGAAWLAAAGCALVALAAIGLALPRFLAAVAALPGDPAVERLYEGEAIERPVLQALVESRRQALARAESGEHWHELALALLYRAQGLPDAEGPDRLADLLASRAAFWQALRQQPLDSHAWLRLAYNEAVLGRLQAAATALLGAIQTAPFQPDQFASRIVLGLQLWDALSADGRDLWAQQVRLAWRHDVTTTKRVLAGLEARTDYRGRLLDALAAVPDAAAWLRRHDPA